MESSNTWPLCLDSCPCHDLFRVHPYYSMCPYLIPFYRCIIFHCMAIPHFVIHSAVGEHLCCFYFLAVRNNVTMTMYKFLYEHLFSFLLGIYLGVEFLDHGNSIFNFLRSYQTLFHSSYTILCSHQQC